MKKSIFHLVLLSFFLVIFGSCKGNSQATEQLGMTPEEAKRLTPEMKELRKASIILSEFVTLKDNQYVLNISMEDALKKGITEELYKKVVKNLENTNQAITNALQKGEKLDFPDPKETFKELREKIK